MNYFIRKIWISVITGILVLITATTATYAYYAMSYSNDIDDFEFEIGSGESILISTDGVKFGSSLSSMDVKRAILEKRLSRSSELSDSEINKLFNFKFEPITPTNRSKLSDGFESIYDKEITSFNYISFDLYLSTNAHLNEGNGIAVYFENNDVVNSSKTEVIRNSQGIINHSTLGVLDDRFYINNKNAMRIGVTTYDLTTVGNVNAASKNPVDTIYSIGGNVPYKDGNEYNFGGYNKGSFNYACESYNAMSTKKIELPSDLEEDEELYYNNIVPEDKCLVNGYMQKITIYLWLEGWDSDCITSLSKTTFDFSLVLSTFSPES